MQNNLYSNAKQLLLQYQTTIIGLHLHFSLHKKQLYLESKTVIYEKRVCQNVHILFFMHKAPTFSSQGFAIS